MGGQEVSVRRSGGSTELSSEGSGDVPLVVAIVVVVMIMMVMILVAVVVVVVVVVPCRGWGFIRTYGTPLRRAGCGSFLRGPELGREYLTMGGSLGGQAGTPAYFFACQAPFLGPLRPPLPPPRGSFRNSLLIISAAGILPGFVKKGSARPNIQRNLTRRRRKEAASIVSGRSFLRAFVHSPPPAPLSTAAGIGGIIQYLFPWFFFFVIGSSRGFFPQLIYGLLLLVGSQLGGRIG